MGHSMPNQQKKILTPFNFMKFGTNMDPIEKRSHNKICRISVVSL